MEAILAYFKNLSKHLSRATEEIKEYKIEILYSHDARVKFHENP
jgi:hypothetical protein